MAGGLFAIDREFFWELGGYDPGLQIWGGEQYELSFKVWQCGGTMLDAPCSRIGHIYRKYAPFPNPGVGDYLGRNYKRVAEVWMDEYADFIYKRRPHYKSIDPGDISDQKTLRNKLQCKSFKWFIEEIAPDLMKVYPPVEPPDFGHGQIRSVSNPNVCVDARFKQHGEKVEVAECSTVGGAEQSFHLTWHRDIRPGHRSVCFDVSSAENDAPVQLYTCHGVGGNQLWRYVAELHQLRHGEPSNSRCLTLRDEDTAGGGGRRLSVSGCDDTNAKQRWTVEHLDQDRLKEWHR